MQNRDAPELLALVNKDPRMTYEGIIYARLELFRHMSNSQVSFCVQMAFASSISSMSMSLIVLNSV